MTAKDLRDISKFLADLQFLQANAIVGFELQGNKQAIKYMKRIAELRDKDVKLAEDYQNLLRTLSH